MMTDENSAGRKTTRPDADIDETPIMDCRAADELIAPYLAHDLKPGPREAFLKHIRTCSDCHDRLFALEFALEVAAREGDDEDTTKEGDGNDEESPFGRSASL